MIPGERRGVVYFSYMGVKIICFAGKPASAGVARSPAVHRRVWWVMALVYGLVLPPPMPPPLPIWVTTPETVKLVSAVPPLYEPSV